MKNRLKDMWREEERVRYMERVPWKLTLPCKIHSQQEFTVRLRKLKQGLHSNLEGWDGREMGGRFKRVGIYVCLWLTHGEV